jgi:hypothetical protein
VLAWNERHLLERSEPDGLAWIDNPIRDQHDLAGGLIDPLLVLLADGLLGKSRQAAGDQRNDQRGAAESGAGGRRDHHPYLMFLDTTEAMSSAA